MEGVEMFKNFEDGRPTPKDLGSVPMHRMKDRPSSPTERLERKIKFYQWGGGIVVSIFISGFFVSQQWGSVATKDGLKARILESTNEHQKTHSVVDRQIEKLDERTIKMFGEQRSMSARQELIQANIELLVQSVDTPAKERDRGFAKRNKQIKETIKTKAERLKVIEDDPLFGLDL
jgi:hypothetical protein